MPWRPLPASRRSGLLLGLSCCATLLGAAAPACADPGLGQRIAPLVRGLAGGLLPRCLTPAVGQAMQDLATAGAFQPALAGEFTLVRGNVGTDQIELEIQDAAQRSYRVTLALPGASSGAADGHGRNFAFHVATSPDPPPPRARAALLAIATLVDGAIPETALVACSGGDQPHGGAHADRRYPRALALASAFVQVLVIAGATVFGLRALGVPGAIGGQEPTG